MKSFKEHRQERSGNRPPWPKGVLQEEAARESTREQVEVALHDMINKLHYRIQERARAARGPEATLRRQCEELRTSRTKTRFERENAIRRIKELENKVRERDCDRETVEAKHHCLTTGHCKPSKNQQGQKGSGGCNSLLN